MSDLGWPLARAARMRGAETAVRDGGRAVGVPAYGRVLVDLNFRLVEFCRGRIAGYKIPRSVSVSDGPLPKSGAGKVLKSVLREPWWAGRTRRVS